jgi:hypothetical protein
LALGIQGAQQVAAPLFNFDSVRRAISKGAQRVGSENDFEMQRVDQYAKQVDKPQPEKFPSRP